VGCRVERERLADDEPADDRDPQGSPKFRARSGTQGHGQRAEHRRHRRHHDRTESEECRLMDGLPWRKSLTAPSCKREVNHDDGVLLHDADEQDETDERNDREVRSGDHQRITFARANC
jgi:hypothetical protein